MDVLIAPDSFKGSMSSMEAANRIASGLKEVDSSIHVTKVPMADGGEGTIEAICEVLEGEIIEKCVKDPLDRPVKAAFGWVEKQKLAVIETAAASGLPLLKKEELDPYRASTYGTGELMKEALDMGAEKIIIGLGGSATVDGGTGCLQALGVEFYDASSNKLRASGGTLNQIASLNSDHFDERLRSVEIVVASDVTNTLLGDEGAVTIFGPQKGVMADELAFFEAGMENFARHVAEHTGHDYKFAEGSGAAGGFGFGLQSFFHPTFESGFALIARLSNLEEKIQSADLVITGEGKFDSQSFYGKVPVEVARVAKKHHVPAISFAGAIEEDRVKAEEFGLSLIYPIVDKPMTLEAALTNGSILLQRASTRLFESIEFAKGWKGDTES